MRFSFLIGSDHITVNYESRIWCIIQQIFQFNNNHMSAYTVTLIQTTTAKHSTLRCICVYIQFSNRIADYHNVIINDSRSFTCTFAVTSSRMWYKCEPNTITSEIFDLSWWCLELTLTLAANIEIQLQHLKLSIPLNLVVLRVLGRMISQINLWLSRNSSTFLLIISRRWKKHLQNSYYHNNLISYQAIHRRQTRSIIDIKKRLDLRFPYECVHHFSYKLHLSVACAIAYDSLWGWMSIKSTF